MEKRTQNGWPMNSLDSRCATTAYKVIIWEHLSRWSFGIVFNHCRYPHIYYHLVALFHSETITKRCDTSMNLVNQSIELVISIIPIANANRVENFLSKKQKKRWEKKKKVFFCCLKRVNGKRSWWRSWAACRASNIDRLLTETLVGAAQVLFLQPTATHLHFIVQRPARKLSIFFFIFFFLLFWLSMLQMNQIASDWPISTGFFLDLNWLSWTSPVMMNSVLCFLDVFISGLIDSW